MQRCTVAGCVFLSGLRPPGWAFHTHVHIPLCTYVDLYVVVLFFNCTSLISFGFFNLNIETIFVVSTHLWS